MREEFWHSAVPDTCCLHSFLLDVLDIGLCWVLLAVKQTGWAEELEQSQCLLCGFHRDENFFFFNPKILRAVIIRSSDCMERISHLTRAEQKSGNIHRLLNSYGMYTIWEVQPCPPTNISMQRNSKHMCWQNQAVTKDVRGSYTFYSKL